MSPTLPLRQLLPALAPDEPALADPTQQAFRQTLAEVEALRARLHDLRAAQATARHTYWRQVGPLATATVAARRALYAPLEAALLGGYLSRAEEQQVTELLLSIARDLQFRFGEDEAELLARYAPPPPDAEAESEPAALAAEPAPAPPEQPTTAGRARRQRRPPAAAPPQVAAETLLGSTKAAYRELARRHHPDRTALASPEAQQAQNALMQRITAAYAAGDFAALLILLAEEPDTSASGVTNPLLTRYTQALQTQRAALARQLTQAQTPDEDQPWSGTEKQQRTRLRETKRALRAETDYLAQLLRLLAEPTALRQWLREVASTGL